jgi:hypothetical protein
VLRETTSGTREEPGTLAQGRRPVFPGSSRLGIEPKGRSHVGPCGHARRAGPRVSALAACHRTTPWAPVTRELPPWATHHERTGPPSAYVGHHGVHSLLQKRRQVRSARVRRHTVFDNLAPLADHSAGIFVPPCRQTPAQCGFFRSHLLVICSAKPRYTAAAAPREHRRVLAPRLPGASVTSPLHKP